MEIKVTNKGIVSLLNLPKSKELFLKQLFLYNLYYGKKDYYTAISRHTVSFKSD